MKTIASILLLGFITSGCSTIERDTRSEYDIELWVTSDAIGTHYDIAHTRLSTEDIKRILTKAKEEPRSGLIIVTQPPATITEALPLLTTAEQCGFSNVVLRLNRTEAERTRVPIK